jgi:capsular exopolysaccharide synthesis family protein
MMAGTILTGVTTVGGAAESNGVGGSLLEPGERGTLVDLTAICWRHRWVFTGVSLGVAVAFYLKSLREVPLYECRATLEVFLPTKRVDFQENAEYPNRIENGILNTQSAKFMSTPVMTRALDTSDLAEGKAYRQGDALAVLRNRVKVNTSRDSWAFDVTLRDEDGERCQRGLDALLAAYFTQLDERSATAVSSSVAFLAQEVEKARKQLDDARQDEQSFRETHHISSSNPDDNDLTRRVTSLNVQRADLDHTMAQGEAQVADIRSAMAQADDAQRQQQLLRIDAIGHHYLVAQQQLLLFQSEAEQKELSQKYLYKHPRMKEKQLEVDARRRQLEDSIELARAAVVASYEQLKRQSEDLSRRIDSAKRDLSDYRETLVRLQGLTQVSHNRELLLDELSRRMAQEEVLAKMDAKQVAVIDPPSPAIGPVNVSHGRSLAMALFLGLASGVLSVLGFEKIDPRVRGSANVREITKLPLLGRVPRLRRSAEQDAEGDDSKTIAAAVVGESYKLLRSTIRLTLSGHSCRRIAVVSPTMGDGKSTVAHHLAGALADGGSRVLLIDVDMRHPSQDQLFGVTTEVGLSLLLAGERATAAVNLRPNLDYLGVGVRPPNPADLLCSPELESFFERSASRYDFIILDTPPVNYVADALIVGAMCDELVLVVRDFGTTRGALVDAMQRLEPVRPKVIGFVLNAARERNEAGSYYIFKGNA